MKKSVALSALILGATAGFAQPPVWTARWIDVPGISGQEYGVYHFRRAFDLATKPAAFSVHVSGDNRYELFANGVRVSWGPARGDLRHWRYERSTSRRNCGQGRTCSLPWSGTMDRIKPSRRSLCGLRSF
jgi:hypothetical protein